MRLSRDRQTDRQTSISLYKYQEILALGLKSRAFLRCVTKMNDSTLYSDVTARKAVA